jgi:hypothetical protein
MGTRPTKKAGIYKPRKVTDPEVLRAINAIIERLEVLDGIRGDNLDQAVTWRDLGRTGFTLGTGAGGTPTITNTPGPGTGDGGTPVPGIGPAGPPSNLAANETYLALLLTWDNTDINLQHVEVWRCDVDNLSLALDENYANGGMIGTTVSPQFIDYVGASASYYYWVRSVGTDGTYSAFNDTAGTLGTTGVDPGEIILDPDNFKLIDGVDVTNPFLVGTLAGDTTAVGLDGTLLIKGSLRAEAIVAGSIGADQVSLNKVDGIFANFGTVQGGLIRTAAPNAFRVEIEDQAATFYPLWYGSGAKGPENGLFYVDRAGNVVIKGLVDGAVIKQTYLTPGTASSMRVATQYPSGMVGGKYVGKQGSVLPFLLLPRKTMDVWINDGSRTPSTKITDETDSLVLYGPQYTGNEIWGRLGSVSEMLVIRIDYDAQPQGPWADPRDIHVNFQYQYDNDGWKVAWYLFHRGGLGSTRDEHYSQTFFTRGTPWNLLKLRLQTELVGTRNTVGRWLVTGQFHVWTPNLGYVGIATSTITTSPSVETLPANPRFI